MSTKISQLRPLLFLTIAVTCLQGCNEIELKSSWRDRDVTIDAESNEWDGKTTPFQDQGLLFGFMNDDKDLYVLLRFTDRSVQRQVASMGLTVWFDRTGGEERKFGISYPLGRGMGPMPDMPRSRRSPGGERAAPDSFPPIPPFFSQELDIYGPMEGEHLRMQVAELTDIRLSLAAPRDALTYELKVPLMDTGAQPFAIGTKAGETIGIGVEVGGRDAARGESGGVMRGGGAGRKGGLPGGTPPAGRGMREPLRQWAKVQLAFQDSSASR